MNKWTRFLLVFTATTPLVVYGKFLSPFVNAKVLFLRGISFGVMLLVSLILTSRSNKNTPDLNSLTNRLELIRKDNLFIAVSLGIFLMAISTLLAFDRSMAFFG